MSMANEIDQALAESGLGIVFVGHRHSNRQAPALKSKVVRRTTGTTGTSVRNRRGTNRAEKSIRRLPKVGWGSFSLAIDIQIGRHQPSSQRPAPITRLLGTSHAPFL